METTRTNDVIYNPRGQAEVFSDHLPFLAFCVRRGWPARLYIYAIEVGGGGRGVGKQWSPARLRTFLYKYIPVCPSAMQQETRIKIRPPEEDNC